MSDKILEIKDLYVEYQTDEDTVYAVNGVDLSLSQGETLGLVGETGAGKTTIALSVMRLLPDKVGRIRSGTIILDGINVTEATKEDMRLLRGDRVSMIFQDPMSSLNPVIPIGKQILEVLEAHNYEKKAKEELEKEVDSLLDMVGLPASRKNEYPHQFSGGMKQRVVIAMALACKPKIILADEPTTALDVTIQAQVLSLIGDLREKINTSMVLITHDLGVVAQICDKVAVIYAGEIIESGTASHIFESEKHHPYTTGLFGAMPDLAGNARRLSPIGGLTPDPTEKIAFCPFSERCPKCMEICKKEKPAQTEIEDGHLIKCFLFYEGLEGGK